MAGRENDYGVDPEKERQGCSSLLRQRMVRLRVRN